MERELWPLLYRLLGEVATAFHQKYVHLQPGPIAAVVLWAAIHDRSVSWACDPAHWDTAGADRPARLPSASTVSRRADAVAVGLLLRAVEARIRGAGGPALVAVIDGKPLPVGGTARTRGRRSAGRPGAWPRGTSSTPCGRTGRSRRRGR